MDTGGLTNATTKARAVADRITTAIAVGSYSPGDRLPSERELAESLGVSRVTVREAIRQVTAVGLLRSRRGRDGGTFVTAANWEELASGVARRTLEEQLPALRELVDHRCLVAGLTARTAAQRCTDEDAERLWTLLEEFDRAADLSAARTADLRLHSAVMDVARNERLARLNVELSTEATLGLGSEPYPASYLARAGQEHRALVDAVTGRRHEEAFDVAQAHYALTLEILEDGLRRAAAASPD